MSRHTDIKRNQEIIDLKKAGKTASEISEAFGISINRVYQICSVKKSVKNVADKPTEKADDSLVANKPVEKNDNSLVTAISEAYYRSKKTEEADKEFGSDLAKEYENGVSIGEIANKYSFSTSTVRRILTKYYYDKDQSEKRKAKETKEKEQKPAEENLRTYDKMKRLQWTIYDICTLVGVRIVGEYQLEDIVTGETYSATGARPTYAVTKNLN